MSLCMHELVIEVAMVSILLNSSFSNTYFAGARTRYVNSQNEIVETPVPTTHCDYPLIVWPRSSTNDGINCHCQPIQADYYTFEACVEQCQTNHNITLSNGSICFNGLNTSLSVHFLCDKDPCTHSSCLMVTVVSSYKISMKVEGNSTVCM